ncbi:hypothetical protein Pmi06nite_20770 [Planotetraspora mira]|uniref:Uncharacterized protein n=1 Tax=Planotetraspora mira TaxID=58121 RepID=A0A8J3TWV5_9ACTN|nr:hypothetical protein Pmi06nite_20770 [Planotetraspora mira]
MTGKEIGDMVGGLPWTPRPCRLIRTQSLQYVDENPQQRGPGDGKRKVMPLL